MGKTRLQRIGMLAGGLLIAGVLIVVPALAQVIIGPGGRVIQPVPPIGQPGPGNDGSQLSALQLTEDPDLREAIAAIREKKAEIEKEKDNEAWGELVMALQKILENEQDHYVRVTADKKGRKVERWTSVKYEANKLLSTIPPAGLQQYELLYGGKARALLNEAKKSGDIQLLAEVAEKYFNTQAGPEANELLATHFLDRGQFFMAALRFERLLNLPPERYKARELTLLKAALAYHRAGDVKNFNRCWERLTKQVGNRGGIRLGDQVVALGDLRRVLDQMPRPRSAGTEDWPLARGNTTATAEAIGSQPLLDEVLWRRPTVLDTYEETGKLDQFGSVARNWINSALEAAQASESPVIPGFFPIAVNGKIIYRSYYNMRAVALKQIADEWGVIKPGSLEWQSVGFEASLAPALENPGMGQTLVQWLQLYQNNGLLNLVYENSLVGTITSDLQNVYTIDDLAVPIYPSQVPLLIGQYGSTQNIPDQVRDRIYNNVLYACDVKTGKLLWKRGNTLTRSGSRSRPDEEFRDTLFLGPPLPVGGKLYVLNETKLGELRLVCLDPDNNGKVVGPIQTIGTISENARFAYDLSRRIHAVHLAYGEGILVCPTNAGQILGIDLTSRSLAWAYPYRESTGGTTTPPIINPGIPPVPMPLPPSGSTWKFAPPVIAEGKVVFTAPDAASLHCISLHDGSLVWKYPRRNSDLFLAGVWHGRVLVVGVNSCKLFDLENGSLIKTIPTHAMPAGHGVFSRGMYYLPLHTGEIVGIDIDAGVIRKRNRPKSSEAPAPGNLVFFEGAVITQTAKEIIAYPQLQHQLEVVRAKVKANPKDLRQRLYLGELLLFDGRLNEAVSQFRFVRDEDPKDPQLVARVRQRLYEALTDLLQADFKTASRQYLDEYQDLIRVPGDSIEEQRRRGQFLRILASGREQEGDLVAAYDAYRRFSEIELYQKQGVPDLEDPHRKIPLSVWLRAKLSAMFASASPEARKPLEKRIAEDWERVRASGDPVKIRGVVSMFDTTFPMGVEARLYLANAIVDRNERDAFLEAELDLREVLSSRSVTKSDAAKALETLARLETQRGTTDSLRAAADYYRKLKRLYPKTPIRDGKTGAELYNEITADKRFLAALGEVGADWGSGEIKVRTTELTDLNTDMLGFMLQPKGTLTRSNRHLRLLIDSTNFQNLKARLVDIERNRARWSIALPFPDANGKLAPFYRTILQNARNLSTYYPEASFRNVHVCGNLGVFQFASEIYAVDLSKGEILWHDSLIDVGLLERANVRVNGLMPNHDGMLYLNLYSPQLRNHTKRLGSVVAVEPSYVAILRGDDLVVVHPLDGKKVLWQQPDVPEPCVIFGDDRYLFLASPTGEGARAMRALDGQLLRVAPFGDAYRNRISLHGHRILTKDVGGEFLTLRLYDIVEGKDVWAKQFPANATVLQSEVEGMTGVVEPSGEVTILALEDGQVVLRGNVRAGKFNRITEADLTGLEDPLLLADRDHFYLALNRPIDGAVVSGGKSGLLSNISSGVRCSIVNGWFCALHRRDGQQTIKGKKRSWKAGDLHWYSSRPIENQQVILEHFESLPVVIFSVRYNRTMKNEQGFVQQQPISLTQSLDRRTGKWILDPEKPRQTNGSSARFTGFEVDRKNRAIRLVSFLGVLEHYVAAEDANRRETGSTDSTVNRGERASSGAAP